MTHNFAYMHDNMYMQIHELLPPPPAASATPVPPMPLHIPMSLPPMQQQPLLQMQQQPLTSMQQQSQYQHPYHLTNLAPNASATPSYELAAIGAEEGAVGSLAACAGGAAHAHLAKRHNVHDHHNVNGHHKVNDQHNVQNHRNVNDHHNNVNDHHNVQDHQNEHNHHNVPCHHEHRKRKSHHFGSSSAFDDEESHGDDSRSCRSLPDKKQNHSEIEKRRRDKMNIYITELSTMIPMCGAMARKLDKLTVLRMAVQHLRSIRGALKACPLTARPKTALLSDQEVDKMILQAAHDCFLIVVGCDRGRLLYVSASAQKLLLYDQTELLGQSLFDLLHPKDVAKVKEQLSSSDFSPRERLIDAKTMLPVKTDLVTTDSRFCTGARRSFFCRIKCRHPSDNRDPVTEETYSSAKIRKQQQPDRKYAVVHCSGYLKTLAPGDMPEGAVDSGVVNDDGDTTSISCLVAVGRKLPDPQTPALTPHRQRPLQFFSRHATDGKFLYVDQRVTLALGFLPQELVGTSLYEYVTGPELSSVARAHKMALLKLTPLQTPAYSFRHKDGSFAKITTHFKPFRNPWTKDVECLVANNTLVVEGQEPKVEELQSTYDYLKPEPDIAVESLIDSQVESHKIGSAIAEEVLRRSSPALSPELPADLLHDVIFNSQPSIVDTILNDAVPYEQVRNNVPLNSTIANSPPHLVPMEASRPDVASPLLPLGVDGNGEATMAVIMSLLEADAGLGGPVNFSELPWPLP